MNLIGDNMNRKLTYNKLKDMVHKYFHKFNPSKGKQFHERINEVAKEFWSQRQRMLRKIISRRVNLS